MRVLALLSVVVMLAGCGGGSSSSQNKVKRQGEPDLAYVGKDDPEMNQAMAKAGQTVQTFLDGLKAPKPSQNSFAIKKAFREGEIVEYIWLGDVTFDGKLLHGTVNNEPVDVKKVKFGQKVSIAPKEVSDWMFVDNGKLVGGHTIRVLYNRESPQGKKQLDRAMGFKIE